MKNLIHGSLPSNLSTKSFYIENLGCAKNQVDAEILGELFTRDGWLWADGPEEAGLIIVNSCGFIRSAKEESIKETLEFKQRFPDKKVLLAGCFAQRYAETGGAKLADIDGILGNRSPADVIAAAGRILSGERVVSVPSSNFSYPERSRFLSYPGSVYVKIAEGCNNNCSYCAIPLIRGPLNSRSVLDVKNEIRSYVENGAAEIVLLAQDAASFGADIEAGGGLISLLQEVMTVPGDFWIRLLYIHPDHFPEELFTVVRDNPRILPYFDIPFQHAAEPLLRQMGREGNKTVYLKLIDKIRNTVPGAVIRSTFLVGFPGEREEDFKQLLDFQDAAEIDWLGVFTYSREEGTRAYRMRGRLGHHLSKKTAEKRKTILEERQKEITGRRLREYVGTKQRVLIEEPVSGERLYIGRTYFQAPEVDGLTVVSGEDCTPGCFAECRITKVTAVDLEATLV